MMHFLSFVFLTVIRVVTADLSDGSDFLLPQTDLSALQDSPENLLFTLDGWTSNAAANNPFVVAADDDGGNLFVGSSNSHDATTADAFSSVGGLGSDPLEFEEASCLPKDGGVGQSSSRMRARGTSGVVCSPNDQTSPDGGIGDFIDNVNGVFGNPLDRTEDEETQGASTRKKDTDPICLPEFPNHLCCEKETEPVLILSPDFLTDFDICEPGM